MKPIYALKPISLNIHFNIIRPGIPIGLFPSRPAKILYIFLMSLMRATRPAYPIVLDIVTEIILGDQYKLRGFSLPSFHTHTKQQVKL
jgi:hypothetical protein